MKTSMSNPTATTEPLAYRVGKYIIGLPTERPGQVLTHTVLRTGGRGILGRSKFARAFAPFRGVARVQCSRCKGRVFSEPITLNTPIYGVCPRCDKGLSLVKIGEVELKQIGDIFPDNIFELEHTGIELTEPVTKQWLCVAQEKG